MKTAVKSYRDYIATGDMTPREAATRQATRESARTMASHMMNSAEVAPDTVAFGMLDVIAVKLVGWYGPAAAAEVFEHYAKVCARQGDDNAKG